MITVALLAFGLLGCGMEPEGRPTLSQLAKFCGVQPAELTKAQSDLRAAVETEALKVGSCKLVKDHSGQIKLLAVRYPPKVAGQ